MNKEQSSNSAQHQKLKTNCVIVSYLKKLNWYGFSIVMLISMAGAASNTNVNSFIEWLFLVLIFGIPFSLIPLFIGKED